MEIISLTNGEVIVETYGYEFFLEPTNRETFTIKKIKVNKEVADERTIIVEDYTDDEIRQIIPKWYKLKNQIIAFVEPYWHECY